MERKNIEKIQDVLGIILNHLLFVAGAITVLAFFRVDHPNLLLWIGLIIVPLLFYHFVKRPQKLVQPATFIICLAILSIVEKKISAQDWSDYYIIITFTYLIGYFIYYFINQFLRFWLLNQSTASNIPTSAIFRSGMGQTMGYVLCGSVILFLSAKVEWVKAIVAYIWTWIQNALQSISRGEDMSKPPTETPMQPDAGMSGNPFGEMLSEDPHYILRALVFFLIVTALVTGVVFCAHWIYYMIIDLDIFQKKVRHNGTLADNDDVREYCGVEKNSIRKKNTFLFRNNREKVRRIYQKRILKRKKELIGEQEESKLKYLTAKQCCDKLSEQQLKLVYEKARYSEEAISSDEVRLVK